MAVRGTQAMAIAVLRLAIKDAAGIVEIRGYSERGESRRGRRSPEGRPESREILQATALAWLSEPSESLEFWCELADIDMGVVIDGVEGAIERICKKTRSGKRL